MCDYRFSPGSSTTSVFVNAPQMCLEQVWKAGFH
jgi:hypothetical protein